MSLLKLPVDLLQDLFDCEELHSNDFKNLRLTNPALNDVTCGKLFQNFTFDLDNPYCIELVIGKQPEPPKAAKCDDCGLIRSGGQIVVEESDDDEQEGEKSETSKAEQIEKAAEEEEQKRREERAEYESHQLVDFETLGRHVRDLKIKGMGNRYPEWRTKLLDLGLGTLIAKMPNLRSISAHFTDRVLINVEWAKLLQSICPPDSKHPDQTNKEEGPRGDERAEENKPWTLNLVIERRMDNVDDDEIYRNLGLVRNVTDLSVSTSMRFGKEARAERIEAGVANLAKAINNCPNLKSLNASFGYYCEFDMDNLLLRIEGDHPLSIEKLNIEFIEGPALLENVRRLVNLKDFHMREPDKSPLPNLIDQDEEQGPPTVHDLCTGKEKGEKGACTWMQMLKCGVLLSKVKVHDICPGFIAYLQNHDLVGTLAELELFGVSGRSKHECSERAEAFWTAISIHAGHIKRLAIDASFYGGYCWQPNNTASEVVKKMINLEYLKMCPATEPTYIPPGERRKRSTNHADHFVGEFIEALWSYKNLKTVRLSFCIPEAERGAWCGTNSLSHRTMMRTVFFRHVGDAKGETKPGFVVKMEGDYFRRMATSEGPMENVWKPRKHSTAGEDEIWRFVNEHKEV